MKVGGGNICFFRYEFLVLGVSFMGECDTLLVFFNVFGLYSRSNYQQRLIIRHLFIEAYRPLNIQHSTFNIQQSLTFSATFPRKLLQV